MKILSYLNYVDVLICINENIAVVAFEDQIINILLSECISFNISCKSLEMSQG